MRISFIQEVIDIIRGKKSLAIINRINWEIKHFRKRLKHEKINIIFLCHRPQVWDSLKTVFEACNNDKRISVTIVATPYKKQLPDVGFSHSLYESEGAEEFFKNYPCNVINAYNYKTKEWFDLKTLQPDYVFIQRPYNICYPTEYSSYKISEYAKIYYVHYASNCIGNGTLELSYPIDFMKYVDTMFLQDFEDMKLVNKYLKKMKIKSKTIMTGFPRYDGLEKFKNIESNNWNLPKNSEIKRVIWTPRWNTKEGTCNFFDYKDFLIDYAEKNKNIDFIFRPHPQAFLEWNSTGEFPELQANEYIKRYENCINAKIDKQKEYLTTFYSSDFMITDISSIIAEYFLTGKPIIYCHKKDCFNDFSRRLSKGFYWVKNTEELEKAIKKLQLGEDPLYEKRQQIIKENFYINPEGAGKTIKKYIVKDFYGKE